MRLFEESKSCYFMMKTSKIIVYLILVFSSTCVYAAFPDVVVDEKATSTSALTLKQIYSRGRLNWKSAAADALSNLSNDKELAGEIRSQASSSTNFSELALKRICAIESRCSLEWAYSKAAYKGFFQMGADACKDVNMKMSEIDEKTEWRKSCEAGRKFLDLTWKRLSSAGAKLDHGKKESLTMIYLTHQLGSERVLNYSKT